VLACDEIAGSRWRKLEGRDAEATIYYCRRRWRFEGSRGFGDGVVDPGG